MVNSSERIKSLRSWWNSQQNRSYLHLVFNILNNVHFLSGGKEWKTIEEFSEVESDNYFYRLVCFRFPDCFPHHHVRVQRILINVDKRNKKSFSSFQNNLSINIYILYKYLQLVWKESDIRKSKIVFLARSVPSIMIMPSHLPDLWLSESWGL